jgi:hypothetical protein
VLQEEVEEGVARFVCIADCHPEQYRCDPPSPNQMVQYAMIKSTESHRKEYNMLYPVSLITVLLFFHPLPDAVRVDHRPLCELL